MNTIKQSSVEKLILVRVLEDRKREMTEKEIGNSLLKILEDYFSVSEWNSCFGNALNSLLNKKQVEEVPKKNKKNKSRYRLTDIGRQISHEYLGAEYYPQKLIWNELKEKYLVALSLGMKIRSEKDLKIFSVSGFLPKAIIKNELNLHQDVPINKAFWDAVYWHALGEQSSQRFLVKDVKCYLLNKVLQADHTLDEAKARAQLPAKLVGALNPRADGLRQALLKRLVNPEDSKPVEPAFSNKSSSTEVLGNPPKAVNLEEFARRVLEVAATAPTGQHGTEKIFISHIWRHFCEHGFAEGMTEAEFKSRLLDANRANYLTLSQEDLPSLVSSDDINASATPYLNATFHYVRIQRR